MLGTSAAMRQVLSMIERSAPTDANVLLLGENGTGKELAARALHSQSARSDGVFMSVDLGAVPEIAVRIGAVRSRQRRFHRRPPGSARPHAGGQRRHAVPRRDRQPAAAPAGKAAVGARAATGVSGWLDPPVAIDVRVIAATNLPRDQLTDETRFRQDLLFRLNTVEIVLPPLQRAP